MGNHAILVLSAVIGYSASFLKLPPIHQPAALCVGQQTWPIYIATMDGLLQLPLKDSAMIEKAASVLDTQTRVPGIDGARFQEIAALAKRDCPLSKALASVPEITLQAILDQGAT